MSYFLILLQRRETQWLELLPKAVSNWTLQGTKATTDIAASFVMLAVRFYPMEPKCVQECRETLTEIKATRSNQQRTSPARVRRAEPYPEYVVRTSMTHRMNTVRLNHITRMNTKYIVPNIPSAPSAPASVISQSTSES
jgi:hypothetical protein